MTTPLDVRDRPFGSTRPPVATKDQALRARLLEV
jgi:hypothetical protein